MSGIDTWMKRFRALREYKTRERVLTDGRYETMTSTQACRFRELQDPRIGTKDNRRSAAPISRQREPRLK